MEEELLDVEEREINEIDGILPLLLQQGLLTEIECRIITSSSELAEKQGAVYRVMMSRTKEEAANLMNIFRNLRANFYSKKNLKLQIPAVLDDSKPNAPENNPFLNKTIINNLLKYLSLKDIKNFRTVCRQWNSTAEILLRTRSRIIFRPEIFLPSTFLKLSKYSLPDLPFSNFVFSKYESDDVWKTSDVQSFFDQWGKNIKNAGFNRLTLTSDPYSDKIPNFYDASPWFATTCNITTLTITCTIKYRPILNISWETLASLSSLKFLYLTRCGILIKPETKFSRISCKEIELYNIGFKQGGKFIPFFRYNDVFDFRRSTHIALQNMRMSKTRYILDTENEVFNADTVILHNVIINNWGKARGCINDLTIVGSPLLQANNLKIKKLKHDRCQVNLLSAPQSVEKMWLLNCVDFLCEQPLYLPNLKSFAFEVCKRNLKVLTKFENCENLTQIVLYNLSTSEPTMPFNARYIPRTVRLLRLGCMQLEFVDDYIWEFSSGTLVLDDVQTYITHITDYEKITSKIRAETLVVVCYKSMEVDSADIMKLVFANKQAKTIIVGAGYANYDLHKQIPFEGSLMSKHVDEKSNYYEFLNQVGRAIPRSEFKKWLKHDVW